MTREGTPVAICNLNMIALFRYTALLVGLLAVAIVIGICGEGACATCAHEWLRADRPERPVGLLAAGLLATVARPAALSRYTSFEAWQAPAPTLAPAAQLSPLRI